MNERRAFREEMGRLRGEMRALAGDPKANQAKIDKLIDQRARLRAEREKSVLRARAQRDEIFTPGQREKIRAFRSGRQGRMGLAGPGRMARPGALRPSPLPGGTAAGTAGRAPKDAPFKIGDMYPGSVSPFSFPAPPGDNPPARVLNRGRIRPLSPGEPAWHDSCF